MTSAEWTADGGDTRVDVLAARGTGLFGIETRQIREVLGTTTPQRVPLAPEYIAGVVPYRGEVLTTVSFRALLGLGALPGRTACWSSTTSRTRNDLV
jgi:chemotaxis signal transduction protein